MTILLQEIRIIVDSMMERFQDNNVEIYSFTDEILVVCSKCNKKAFVFTVDDNATLVCHKCGYSKNYLMHSLEMCSKKNDATKVKRDSSALTSYNVTAVGGPFDPYFNSDLYLKINCCGNVLFAFNGAHLKHIKEYVRSSLRERNKSSNHYKNRSMISRLPQWIKDKHNREEILSKIEILEKKIAEDK